MNTEELLYWAKTGDLKAKQELFLQYRPLIISRSMVGGRFCEDLYQELSITFLGCIQRFCLEKAVRSGKKQQ